MLRRGRLQDGQYPEVVVVDMDGQDECDDLPEGAQEPVINNLEQTGHSGL